MNTNQAGFGRRLIALLLEGSLRFLLFLPLFAAMAMSTSLPNLAYNVFLYIIVILFFAFLFIIYDTLMFHFLYGNLGQLLTGIHVVDAHGQRLTIRRILFRNLIGCSFAGLVFGLGYWTIITDKSKQGWQDKVVGSYVITKQKFLWIFALLLFLLIAAGETMFLIQQFSHFIQGPVLKQINQLITQREKETKIANYNPENLVSKSFYEKNVAIGNLYKKGETKEALTQATALRKAAKTNEEKAVAENLLGVTSGYIDDIVTEKHFQNAIKFYPNFIQAYANLSLVQSHQKKGDEALMNAQKAIKVFPNDAFFRYVLSVAYFTKNDIPQATKEMEIAVKLDPKNEGYKSYLAALKNPQDNTSTSKTTSSTMQTPVSGSRIYGDYTDGSSNAFVTSSPLSITISNQQTGVKQSRSSKPSWSFDNLTPGTYTVSFTPLDGYHISSLVYNGGTYGAGGDQTMGNSRTVTLDAQKPIGIKVIYIPNN